MTELKTLKDLGKTIVWIDALQTQFKKDENGQFVITKELKQEAIKWVKAWLKEEKELIETESDEFDRGWTGGCQEMMEDFKSFFNITEEDLK